MQGAVGESQEMGRGRSLWGCHKSFKCTLQSPGRHQEWSTGRHGVRLVFSRDHGDTGTKTDLRWGQAWKQTDREAVEAATRGDRASPEMAWRRDLPDTGSSDIPPRVSVPLGLSAALNAANFSAQPHASPLSPGPRFCHHRHPPSAPCSLISLGDLRDPGAAAIPELGWLPVSDSPGQHGWMFARPFHLGSPQLPPT